MQIKNQLKILHTRRTNLAVRLGALIILVLLAVKFNEPKILFWQIGKPDKDNREFALAPNHYREFNKDGLFVVGQSDSQTDWPYVHPGPGDNWAGKRRHKFTILFGVKNPPKGGQCRLKLKTLDRVRIGPPRLQVEINGHIIENRLPPGLGDASIQGRPDKGNPFQFEIPFTADWLKSGDNEIHLTTIAGSWFLYDWVGLEVPFGTKSSPVSSHTWLENIQLLHPLQKKDGKLLQKVRFKFQHFGNPTEVVIHPERNDPVKAPLKKISEIVEVPVSAVNKETLLKVFVEEADKIIATRMLTLKPVRRMTIFILPHSHTDIGYTEIQTAVEEKQINNLLQGIEYARKTKNYPEGARFIWNVEVLWAADLYLRRLSPAQRAQFLEAVKKGRVSLNGMYLNELTGLCRPEELLSLFRFSTQLAGRVGVKIDSAMTSDVPGQTWGTVTAMGQAGIKYFSTAPNYFDRIGDINVQWEDKPFYWVSPSGKEKVLVWIPNKGYALSHLIKNLTPEFVENYLSQLEKKGYPFDITHIRWSGQGDNAAPDLSICEFVKAWNKRFAWPKFIIASTSQTFRTFEHRYGKQLPQVRGDWTPYWEDGAASSALETAMNRNSSDRLTQAEALWTMFNPAGYPSPAFEEAWRNVLLFSEHSWGAEGSVSDPESKETKEQWKIKQSYAIQADKQSRDLLTLALESRGKYRGFPRSKRPNNRNSSGFHSEIDVFNTTSWRRTDFVLLSKKLSAPGDRVTDDRGLPVPSQRLSSGELAFIARDIPPFAGRRYRLSAGVPFAGGKVRASDSSLENGILHIGIDKKTGGIKDLWSETVKVNLADTTSDHRLNDYLYLNGDNLADVKRNGPVKITIKEHGPLIASLLIESKAPGCNKLSREVRLFDGLDYFELINIVDKKKLVAKSYLDKKGKESVNFAFPFKVPEGRMLVDIPLGVMRPELDQLPGSCKNWLTVGRWVDLSNRDIGITWIPLDAPLVQIGGITATLLNSQTNPNVWRKKIEPTQKLYSWVMNNHWGTNYRAYQEGPTKFRFYLRPHQCSTPLEASRLAIGLSQPLIAAQAKGAVPVAESLIKVHSKEVLVTSLKPSDDGHALIIRLFGAAGKTVHTGISWAKPKPKRIWLSDTSEKRRKKANEMIEVPAYGLVTLRAELGH